jgi:cysteine desulfuration protein SufE
MTMTADHPASVRVRAIVEEFALFDDWTGRYEHLIEQARGLAPLDPALRTDANRVHGCQSQVWLASSMQEGHIRYHADSDALITRGLVALLVRAFDGLSPSDILSGDVEWLAEIGMQDHLSSTRKNGLDAMVRRMKALASAVHDVHPPDPAT